jgi:hypothetical protein
MKLQAMLNHLNVKLNPICPLLTLFGVPHILHVSRLRVKQAQRRQPNASRFTYVHSVITGCPINYHGQFVSTIRYTAVVPCS